MSGSWRWGPPCGSAFPIRDRSSWGRSSPRRCARSESSWSLDTFGEVESQKTVIELPSPVTGTVRAVNEAIRDDPSLINVDPYGKGWLVEVEIDEPEELERMMNGEDYETFVEE